MKIRTIRTARTIRLARHTTVASLALAILGFLGPRPLEAQDSTKGAKPRSSANPVKPAAKTGAKPTTHRVKSSTKRVARTAGTDGAGADSVEAPPTWPVVFPNALPGSVLPTRRIIAYYGNPLSKRMGVLGELPVDQMLAKLDREVQRWNEADPSTPAQPALHMIVSVAQGAPGRDGKYRQRSDTALIERVYGWAKRKNALLFLDVQVGQSTLQEELPRLEPFLRRPDVHLAIDPEFSMHHADEGKVPGTSIGTFDAADVNWAASFLANIVTTNKLPPKVLVVHRFTHDMVTNSDRIRLDPRVQIVVNMDGWGPPSLKRDSYRRYILKHPVEFTGFKLFYHNDTKRGNPLMTPKQVLALFPRPLYIQYQ